MRARIKLVDPIDKDPYYAVYYHVSEERGWDIMKVFNFRYGEDAVSVWSQEKNLAAAKELAKRIEESSGSNETIIYETPENT